MEAPNPNPCFIVCISHIHQHPAYQGRFTPITGIQTTYNWAELLKHLLKGKLQGAAFLGGRCNQPDDLFHIFQLPSGYVKITMENHHRNSEFSHDKWWFSIVFCMFTRPGTPEEKSRRVMAEGMCWQFSPIGSGKSKCPGCSSPRWLPNLEMAAVPTPAHWWSFGPIFHQLLTWLVFNTQKKAG